MISYTGPDVRLGRIGVARRLLLPTIEIEGPRGSIVVHAGSRMTVASDGLASDGAIGAPLRSWMSNPWYVNQQGTLDGWQSVQSGAGCLIGCDDRGDLPGIESRHLRCRHGLQLREPEAHDVRGR